MAKVRFKIRKNLEKIMHTSKAPSWYKWFYKKILRGSSYDTFLFHFGEIGHYEYGRMFKKEDGNWYVEKTWVPFTFTLPDLRSIITDNSLK